MTEPRTVRVPVRGKGDEHGGFEEWPIHPGRYPPGLAIVKNPEGRWSVTHTPSGLSVRTFVLLKSARAFVKLAATAGDWNRPSEAIHADADLKATMRKLIEANRLP